MKIAFAFVDVAMIVVSFVFCNELFLGITSPPFLFLCDVPLFVMVG